MRPYAEYETALVIALRNLNDGRTIQQVAREAGLDVQSLYKMRDRKAGLTPVNTERLAAALGYSILLCREDRDSKLGKQRKSVLGQLEAAAREFAESDSGVSAACKIYHVVCRVIEEMRGIR